MNKNILNIHLDVLDSKRREALRKLLLVIKDFVLGGGTALALQLNHRRSFDFDFFSLQPIPKTLLENLSKRISIQNIAVDTSDELTFFNSDDIKITFLYYPFKPSFKILKLKNKLQIFSIKEIALQKAYTIGRRGEYRDYFDLYTILKQDYIKLDDLILLTKKVYKGAFDEKLFLEQLVYFDDFSNFNIIPSSSLPLPTSEEVKKYFISIVHQTTSKLF
jgi:predicted nucleotidyltransferase component of viral defense system